MKRKLVVISNTEWSIYNFRSELVEKMLSEGFDVHIVCERQAVRHYFSESQNIHNIALNITTGLFSEILKFISLFFLFLKIRPDCVLSFTIKPNLYTALLKIFFRYHLIVNITGLGKMFADRKHPFIKTLFKSFYRKAVRISDIVFYQNKSIPKTLEFDPDNQKYVLLPGSGVPKSDLKKDYKNHSEKLKFVFVGRLLMNKGIQEYVLSAGEIIKRYPNVSFDIYGFTSTDGLGEITLEQINKMACENGVNFNGPLQDASKKIVTYDCLICPTFYNEGLPRVLLEAGSVGLFTIATKIPGCEEIITDGFNGLLCEPQSVSSLTSKISEFIQMTIVERAKIGNNAKIRVEASFTIDIVLAEYQKAVNLIDAHP